MRSVPAMWSPTVARLLRIGPIDGIRCLEAPDQIVSCGQVRLQRSLVSREDGGFGNVACERDSELSAVPHFRTGRDGERRVAAHEQNDIHRPGEERFPAINITARV